MEHKPMPGELYRHFKNKLYQIVAIAKHSETGEELVVYQALYGNYEVYARPLAMFMGEVDHKKYPKVKQKYRFERVRSFGRPEERGTKKVEGAAEEKEAKVAEKPLGTAGQTQAPTEDTGENASGVDPRIMAFLEADSFEKRCNMLVSMRDAITNSMIDTMAAAVDAVIPEGPLPKRYDDLLYVLRTKLQYETANRLRG